MKKTLAIISMAVIHLSVWHQPAPAIGETLHFDADGLAKAVAVLLNAAAAPPDLLFVDEIGPLELQRNEGFAPVLELLPLDGPGHVLVVVRPSLLAALRRRLGRMDFSIYTVTEDNRAILPEIIVREFWAHD